MNCKELPEYFVNKNGDKNEINIGQRMQIDIVNYAIQAEQYEKTIEWTGNLSREKYDRLKEIRNGGRNKKILIAIEIIQKAR